MKKSEAIAIFGTQEKLAQALTDAGNEITQGAIAQWPEDQVPKRREYEIKAIVEGQKKPRKRKTAKA